MSDGMELQDVHLNWKVKEQFDYFCKFLLSYSCMRIWKKIYYYIWFVSSYIIFSSNT